MTPYCHLETIHNEVETTMPARELSPQVRAALLSQTIELPSWAFGNSGTRFKVFAQAGVPRDPFEKISDAAQVNRYTQAAPRVSLHIPWDLVDDYEVLAAHARDNGVTIGAINSNLFQDDDYMLGSLTNPDPIVRKKAIDHHLQCLDIMRATGSTDLKLWLPDGLNYPGQDNLCARQDRLAEGLAEIYAALDPEHRLVIEYKFFEPSFYATDIPDWGTALLHCLALGEQAVVVLDTGHHAPGTNIEFIVAQLLRQGRLGAFDFNSRFYADDDLMAGAADPFQLFRIMHEIVSAGALAPDSGVNFMLDQCHNIEPKIPAQIRSVMNIQEATAKALLVDTVALEAAQSSGDVLAANGALMDAYNTDVRGLLAGLREDQGLHPDPMAAYAASGYAEKIVAERVGGAQAGWGA
ncbi:L-rhamnose isomerase / sugar isomerase [Sanguibacter gelidistatuariae]|uniref:L-rhamnose isomerase / sugar isomerase n=2 Tax=Sanguibacter gelidistatuariae TaxID=1814289 RepID=A0A1G6UQT0_9MICO|nr:L-rhamnose isomerase / sugar isomerase [Sanguibacter gelidistatuariae]